MPRTRSLAWSELKLGILVVAALVVAAIFAFMVGGEGGLPWQRYHLKTRFPNVQGLKGGAVVRLAGVEVGQVSEVQFVGTQVEVTMEISEDVQDKITEQSRAMIGSISLLGETSIDIASVGIGRPIPDWGYIPSQKTPGQIAEVAEQAGTGIAEATELLRDIRRGRGTVGKLFTDEQVYRELYLDLLGFRLSDHIDMPGGVSGVFTHCNPRHHSFAFAASPSRPIGVGHLMFEVDDLDVLGRSYDKVLAGAAPILSTFGKHTNDKMISFYVETPSRTQIEYGTGGIFVDDEVWVPTQYPSAHYWGHDREGR